MKTIYLAGGCFWGVQKFFDQFDGIVNTVVGYANGITENPKYEDVKHEITKHAETVKIDYDESIISLNQILEYYFMVIDPTSINKQGGDIGISYRTGIYYVDKKDEDIIKAYCANVQKSYVLPLAVEIEPLDNFYNAEDYHQKYLDNNPTGYCHIPLNLLNLKK